MEGVRRWMTAHPPPTTRKMSAKAVPQATSKPKVEPEAPDPNTLEGVVYRLMQPEVSEVEVAEYRWYVYSPSMG